eukprot:TRINITY_DN2126_c0_g1_i4.p1 TRINITY_DN2126_c0_g1~~TRINITY_DN2126_c0_g1_i4.p1  ORF type:complete len:527 (+),score=25.04 TRINITY_DN2126_c0_g1_i4:114-1694(+)
MNLKFTTKSIPILFSNCKKLAVSKKQLKSYQQNSQFQDNRSNNILKALQIDEARVQQDQSDTQTEQFNWTKQWYPVHIILHMDPKRPTPIRLLGKDLVVWRDGEGVWRCFEDKCPHRLVPLSEGRLETDGTLQCAYHGWRFDGKGECTKIPQAEPEIEEKLCGSKRACAIVYPTQEKYGLLWVWGESGPKALLESLEKDIKLPPLIEEISKGSKIYKVTDMPYSLETFVENVIDPAHARFTHHGLLTNRNNARPVNYRIEQHATTNGGFLMNLNAPKQGADPPARKSLISFQPPGVVQYLTSSNRGTYILYFMASPTVPGECRMISIGGSFNPQGKPVTPPLAKWVPRWYTHQISNLVLAQDGVFLSKQQQYLQKNNIPKPVTSSFYMPTTSDVAVVELHKWLNKMAGGGPSFAQGSVARQLTQEDMIDTYSQHTRLCKFCSNALENFRKLRIFALAGCVVLAAMALMYAVTKPMLSVQITKSSVNLLPLYSLLGGLGAMISAVVAIVCQGYINKFNRIKFSHSDN